MPEIVEICSDCGGDIHYHTADGAVYPNYHKCDKCGRINGPVKEAEVVSELTPKMIAAIKAAVERDNIAWQTYFDCSEPTREISVEQIESRNAVLIALTKNAPALLDMADECLRLREENEQLRRDLSETRAELVAAYDACAMEGLE